MESNVSGHWTDQQMIAHLYGLGPSDDEHMRGCAACSARIESMKTARHAVDAAEPAISEGEFQLLAAQRRQIHARIAAAPNRWNARRWIPATAALLALAGGLTVYERQQASYHPDTADSVSDAELVQQVADMAQEPEPPATAPLQGLFE